MFNLIRLWHLLWHNMFRLFYIVLVRFSYFRQLIGKNKNEKENNSESMIQDYLTKLQVAKKNNEKTYFSGFALNV